MSKTTWIVIGVVGLIVLGGGTAAAIHRPSKTAAGPSKPPAPVKAGEKVSADTYQIIKQKRYGLRYAKVTRLPNSKRIEFTPDTNGYFTRNVTQDGFAEIKPA